MQYIVTRWGKNAEELLESERYHLLKIISGYESIFLTWRRPDIFKRKYQKIKVEI